MQHELRCLGSKGRAARLFAANSHLHTQLHSKEN
jgi:hypothetical protein